MIAAQTFKSNTADFHKLVGRMSEINAYLATLPAVMNATTLLKKLSILEICIPNIVIVKRLRE
jgi:hypothetical protein